MTLVPHRRRILAAAEGAEPMGWARALLLMAIVAGVLWVIQLLNWMDDQGLARFGLRPRELSGLDGVLTMPFLHSGWWHLASNTPPFVILGWAVLISGIRVWAIVTVLIVVLGGLATWLVAPHGLIVGSSALVFGWLGYLLARAIFARRILWIVGAAFLAFFFSGLFAGLLPTVNANVSWQAHACGFSAGVFVGWLVHPRAEKRSNTQRMFAQ